MAVALVKGLQLGTYDCIIWC